MPEIDLKPSEYRTKRTVIYQMIGHASKHDLFVATLLGVWAASVWAGHFLFHLTPNPLVAGIIGFAPGVSWYLWLAFTDQ